MGCFSYLCKVCGEPVKSDSARGDLVTLFLLKDGVVVEEMTGEYDSYGRVFVEEEPPEGRRLRESKFWGGAQSEEEFWRIWHDLCELHAGDDRRSGFAAIHERCGGGSDFAPRMRSENDPDQGWGRPDSREPWASTWRSEDDPLGEEEEESWLDCDDPEYDDYDCPPR